MLLCHAMALHERGVPLYVDVLPFEGEQIMNLTVDRIDAEAITISGFDSDPIPHGCEPGAALEDADTPAGRITCHLQGDDPVSMLLAVGMPEDAINTMVLSAFRHYQEVSR